MKPMLENQVLYFGSARPPVAEAILHAGPIEVLFRDGVFRYLRVGKREILRAVYFAVRDAHWRTIAGELSNLDIRAGAESFQVMYDCVHRARDIDFRWHAKVSGYVDGKIVWSAQGEAFSSFYKNRIGYCVLHPSTEYSGAPCEIRHSDGAVEVTRFPIGVAPHQPFLDVAAMRMFPGEEFDFELEFTGDQFETEDQRNWTDASFKTYSTPLARPCPVRLVKGENVSQSIGMKLNGKSAVEDHSSPDSEVRFTVYPEERTRLPRIGLKSASLIERQSEKAILRLRDLRLDHLSAELIPGDSTSEAEFLSAATTARHLGVPLEVALTAVEDSDALKRILIKIQSESISVCRWLADFQMQQPDRKLELEALEAVAQVAIGTGQNYAELNRNRPSECPKGGVHFSLNPQVHADDDATLIENLAAQSSVMSSLRDWIGNAPIVVSPVTLKPRIARSQGDENLPSGTIAMPDDVDPRQWSLLGAGWTLGSLKHLAQSGADSVTYYETAGWKGVLASQTASRLEGQFAPIPDAVFPVYHVFRDILEWKEAEVLRTESADPLRVDGIALMQADGVRVMLANFQTAKVNVVLDLGGLAKSAGSRQMNATNAEECMVYPESFGLTRTLPLIQTEGMFRLELEPYALATIDAWAGEEPACGANALHAGEP